MSVLCMRRVGLPCLLALAVSVAPVGAAEPSAKERAAQLLQEGVQRRAEGKDDVAMHLFRRADELDSTPKSRAQLALAEQSVGMWTSAERHLQDALSHRDDPWIERNRLLLESAAARIATELGWIDIVGAPPGAEVFVDGERVGTTPLDAPLRAAAGRRILTVRAAGYETFTRPLFVQGGEVSRERAVFVEVQAGAPPTASASKTPPRYVDVPVTSPLREVGWVTMGVGAAGLLLGGASLVVRQSFVDGFNGDERCGTSAADQPASCRSQQSGATRWGAVGAASLVAGGIVAAGGLVLLLVSPPRHTKVQVARASASCGVFVGGLTCTGRF